MISIPTIVDEIVANRAEHDGVTVLGGEPFDQPKEVAELLSRMILYDLHITIYSGYPMEVLMQKKNPSIDYILTHVDLLIDGPFVANLSDRASEYRGSRNQRPSMSLDDREKTRASPDQVITKRGSLQKFLSGETGQAGRGGHSAVRGDEGLTQYDRHR